MIQGLCSIFDLCFFFLLIVKKKRVKNRRIETLLDSKRVALSKNVEMSERKSSESPKI